MSRARVISVAMARPRPFRGLRYTSAAGDLDALLSPPTAILTPAERERYANRSPRNVVAVAAPEGQGDDRSKFVRFARSAARLAEWRREGLLALEARPAFYRLVHRYGPDRTPRTALLAVVSPADLTPVEEGDPKLREDRLRLLEATQTVFEPTMAFYEDPDGSRLRTIAAAPAVAEATAALDHVDVVIEPIEDPDAIAAIVAAFADTVLLMADGVETAEAAEGFPGAKGVLVALASLDDPAYHRLPVHRVVRRLPGGVEGALVRLAESFEIEEHHNRNLVIYVDRARSQGRIAFGMATEGGRGFLLTPRHPLGATAAAWLQREVLGSRLGLSEADTTLVFTDPIQAVRAADEGAAAAFILPTPAPTELQDVHRQGVRLPAHSARSYPAVPAGFVFWPMGDDA